MGEKLFCGKVKQQKLRTKNFPNGAQSLKALIKKAYGKSK